MNILFVVPTYKPAYVYGGTIVVTAQLAEHLVRQGHSVTVYTTSANGDTDLDVDPNETVLVDGVKVRYFDRITTGHTFAAPALWRHLNRTVKSFDVVHVHSWWNFLVIVAVWICRLNGITPVLSPHGMFSDYILTARNQRKKKWMQRLFGKRLLKKTFLHVSTRMEDNEAKKLIPEWRGAIISNLVTFSDKKYVRPANDIFTIGFLSRIDPKKGLDILIKALSHVDFPYKLLVAGSGNEDYVDSLRAISHECGNSENIEWVGWKNGEEKFEFLSQLDLFALTSHSENFAIVVLEALFVGTPVLISNQVGLFEYVLENGCGWVCERGVAQVAESLQEIFVDFDKRRRIAEFGPPMIDKDYDDENLTSRYVRFYEEIRGQHFAGQENLPILRN